MINKNKRTRKNYMSETGYDDFVKQIEGYSEELQCYLSLTLIVDETSGDFQLEECRVTSNSEHLGEDASFLMGKEIHLLDHAQAAVYTLTFSDKGNRVTGKLEEQKLAQERNVQFRDIYSGMLFEITFGVDGVPRRVGFRADEPFIGSEDEDKPLTKTKEGDYEVNNSHFVNRTFTVYNQAKQEMLKMSLGENGLNGRVKFSDHKKGVTLKALIKGLNKQKSATADEGVSAEDKQLEAISKLDNLIEEVRQLPALGDRMQILEQIQAKAHANYALSKIYDAEELEDKDPLLGSVTSGFGHMALLGNPGTLKTVMGEVLYEAGKASGKVEGPLKWVNGRDIVKGYVGQTETKMKSIIDEVIAQKGMLIIDEFHALNDVGLSNKGAEFGANAVRMLIGAMETNRDDFTVVLAGYPKPVEAAIKQIDPGLKDRLSMIYKLDDYNADELYEIFEYLVPKRYTVSPKAKDMVRAKISDAVAKKDDTFSNGRLMRKLVASLVEAQNLRHTRDGLFKEILDVDDSGELTEEFIKAARAEARSIIAEDVANVDLTALDEKKHVNSMGFAADIRSQTPANDMVKPIVVKKRSRKPISVRITP